MKLKEIAEILGKDVFEVSQMLRKGEVIDIKLSDREARPQKQKDELRIIRV